MTTKKTRFKAGDEVTINATVTIPDGDDRAGADCVVITIYGHAVPVRLHVDNVKKTGRSEREARYFLDPAD
jgi:hypothetical protein